MASLIPQNFITSLLARSDIVEIIDTRVPLRKKGKHYVACCPFHQESTPSFTVTPDKGFYHCFGCGQSGNAVSFIMAYERLEFIDAIESLAHRVGLSVPREGARSSTLASENPYSILEQAVQFYQQQLQQSPKARAYLSQRGIEEETLQRFRLGFAPESWTALLQALRKKGHTPVGLQTAGLIISKENRYYDRFRTRILFPIRDIRGRCIGFGARILPGGNDPKYLNSPETAVFHKGRELYGLYEAAQRRPQFKRLWVVEGYMDVLTLSSSIPEVVATLGTTTSSAHLLRLFSLTEEVVFCFDGDQAGQKAAWRSLETSLPMLQDGWCFRFLFLPTGEDPDSWVCHHGFIALENLLKEESLSLEDFFFKQLTDEIDLTRTEGKAKLTAKALPLLKKMPFSVTRQQLQERLAHLTKMSVEALTYLMTGKTTLARQAPKILPRSNRSPVDQITALLLQQPILAQQFDSAARALVASEYPLLAQLLTAIDTNPSIKMGALLEYFRDQNEYSEQLAQLAHYHLQVPENGLLIEFQDGLKHLKKVSIKKAIESLMQKARQQGLSTEEKQTLHNLIRHHSKE